jgi:hypothetical protein
MEKKYPTIQHFARRHASKTSLLLAMATPNASVDTPYHLSPANLAVQTEDTGSNLISMKYYTARGRPATPYPLCQAPAWKQPA